MTLTNCTDAVLRSAIRNGGRILLDCDGVITLTNTIVISKSVTIDAGDNAVVISGGGALRLFVIEPGQSVTFRNVGILNGKQTTTNRFNGGIATLGGAAIYNSQSTVYLDGCTVSSHTVLGQNGPAGATNGDGENGEPGQSAYAGAIYNDGGAVVLTNCIVGGNAALGGFGGAGGPGASAGNGRNGGNGGRGGSALGGAIYNTRSGIVMLLDSTVITNFVSGGDGGLGGAASGFLGFNGQNGATGNGQGGAIYNDQGTVWVVGCTFNANRAAGGNGANGLNAVRSEQGEHGRTGGAGLGGAIYHIAGPLGITNSTFVANDALGGAGGKGGKGGTSSFGGHGGDGGGGGSGLGGAVYNLSTGSNSIVHATFFENIARGGEGGEGGDAGGVGGLGGEKGVTGSAAGGAIYDETGALVVANSILAFSQGNNAGGSPRDLGGNISTDNTLITNRESFAGTNPLLLPLAENGGPTATYALATNSPAINRAKGAYCAALDQRRLNRTGFCDSGAYEFGATLTLTASSRTNGLALSWPARNSDFILERATNLTGVINWQAATNAVSTVGESNQVIISPSLPSGFFRLRSMD